MSTALNAAAQRQLREDAEAEAARPKPLNPPFPHAVTPFDPAVFGVLADPPASVDSPPKPAPQTP